MHRRLYALALLAALSIADAQTNDQTRAPAVRQIGTTRLENVPEIPAEVSAAVQRYQNDREAVFEGWLADGSMLIATRFGESQQLHRVTAPGGARTQIRTRTAMYVVSWRSTLRAASRACSRPI